MKDRARPDFAKAGAFRRKNKKHKKTDLRRRLENSNETDFRTFDSKMNRRLRAAEEFCEKTCKSMDLVDRYKNESLIQK